MREADVVLDDGDLIAVDDDADFDQAMTELIARCEHELGLSPEPARAAQLHYEIAQACEQAVSDLERAGTHYAAAVDLAPDHVPSLRGLRRVLIALGRAADTLMVFDAEVAVASNSADRARLWYARGRLLEDALGDAAGARDAYEAALEQSPNDPSMLKAVERTSRAARDWGRLAAVYERVANAVTADPPYRAALIAARARLLETELDDASGAAELYQLALDVYPRAAGVANALERLHTQYGEWSRLVGELARAAERAEDPGERSALYYRIAQVHQGELGNRSAAIDALCAALEAVPDDPVALEQLVYLYREAGDTAALCDRLRALVDITEEPADRVALLHSLGSAFEVSDEDEAIRCYRKALASDPTYIPALQALGALLASRGDWLSLIDMHLAEAEGTEQTVRRAAAHARVAEIYEARLDRPSDAASHHARALALVPNHPASFKALVRLYAQAGEHRKLIELYERAVDEAPSLERKLAYLFKIGALWEDALDDPVQAAHAYRRALKLREDDLGALHALQRVCERAGRHQELVGYLLHEADLTDERALEVGLRHRAATVFDEHLGDADSARRLLLAVLELAPDFVPALASLGRIYYRAGRWSELLDMYRRELAVTAEGTPRAALLTKMGELCELRLGDEAAAVEHYRSAAEADASYRPAVRALVRLQRRSAQHDELLWVLDKQLSALTTPAARARTLYRMAEVCEHDIDDVDRAIAFCRQALAEVPNHAPSMRALTRLLEHAEAWRELVEHLEVIAVHASDDVSAIAARLRQAELLLALDEPERALEPLEIALHMGAGMPSLLFLELVHARIGEPEGLIEVYQRQAEYVEHPESRLGVLRQLARLQEVTGAEEAARVQTYDAILKLSPDDPESLDRLVELRSAADDREALARLFSRQGKAATDPRVAADHWLRLGELLEAGDDDRAFAAYVATVERAPDTLAAVRGVVRTARRHGDDQAVADALRREAGLSGDPVLAAGVLVDSAARRLDSLDDRDGALADLERALDLCPDHAPAAERLVAVLQSDGDRERLIDVLSRAAGSARDADRVAALWLAVANAYEAVDVGAAIAAVKRGLSARPSSLPCLRGLARMYEQNSQWAEAAATHDKIAAADVVDEVRVDSYLAQARMWGERLGKVDRALVSVQAALDMAPGHRAARRVLAELQLRSGDTTSAATTARELFATAETAPERASALALEAAVLHRTGDAAGAENQYAEAVALEGADGNALDALCSLAADSGHWQIVAGALDRYLRGHGDGEPHPDTFLALADVYAERMGLPGKAIETLQAGLGAGDDPRLLAKLVDLLRRNGQTGQAVGLLAGRVQRSPRDPAGWRALAELFGAEGARSRERRAVSALAALGATTAEDARRLSPQAPPVPRAGTLDLAVLHGIAFEGVTRAPAAELIAAAADGLAKLWGTDPRAIGLNRRDRVAPRSGHPVRAVLDELCAAANVECELYERDDGPCVEVALADPPAILVTPEVAALPAAQQSFLLGRAVAMIAARLHPVLVLSAESLGQVLSAAAGEPVTLDDGDDLGQRLRKQIPRKWRRSYETAAERYASAPLVDAAPWRRAVIATANRTAALLADDLAAARAGLALLGEVEPATMGDLLRFWMSDAAVQARSALGIDGAAGW